MLDVGFAHVDWAILIVSLVIVFYAGMVGKRYVRHSTDFLVAGRQLGPYVGTISMMSTEIGIVTFMYYAEMGVLYGFSAFIAGLVAAATHLFLGVTGFMIKKFRELELVTLPQFFEQRYNRRVRVLAGVLMAVGGALNFGVFPIIEATFLNIVTGIPRDYIILTMVIMLGMVLVYTTLGGMVSVLVTNYIQYVILAAGMVIVTWYCFSVVGWDPMVKTVESEMGELGFDALAHPSFGWQFLLWQVLAWLAGLTAWAPVAVRAFSSENPEIGKKIFRWAAVLFLGRATLPMIWGIAALTYLQGRDFVPIEGAPMFFREVLPMGIKGTVVAAMLAASMSTYSGYLLAFSSVISEDIIIPLRKRALSERTELIINRVTVLLLSVFIIIWGLFYVVPAATYFYLQMTANLFLAGTFWALVGGLYWNKAHALGAYWALIFGASSTLIYFLIPNPEEWTGAIGVASYILAFMGMVAGSLIGTYVHSRRIRILLSVAVILSAVLGLYVYWAIPSRDIWLNSWIVLIWVSAATFIALSAYAIVKGFTELKEMLRRMPGV